MCRCARSAGRWLAVSEDSWEDAGPEEGIISQGKMASRSFFGTGTILDYYGVIKEARMTGQGKRKRKKLFPFLYICGMTQKGKKLAKGDEFLPAMKAISTIWYFIEVSKETHWLRSRCDCAIAPRPSRRASSFRRQTKTETS
ncbi:unnamed protein product [Cylicostephanus goldi]|uniref:Uncharacterized protein n=1 Tax=Cylicostephanus goldi TaxID=71465 RepID=A0A3P7MUC7_CYLGO|nr:unnamed protein product [Cylicostephanus goldi]